MEAAHSVPRVGEVIGAVQSVNVGQPRMVDWQGRQVSSAIWKLPVNGRIPVRGVNLDGDDQADRRVHGGSDKAVYAYSREDYDWWEGELGVELGPGTFGENLTVSMGTSLDDALVGERWRVGTCELEVCQPRLPCFKLGMKMGDPTFVKRFGAGDRPGAYLRIVGDGDVAAGDQIVLLRVPEHQVSVRLVARALLGDHGLASRMLAAGALPVRLQEWARSRGVG